MHDLNDSFRNKRKFRIRGKWELILVLLVVIAGVVVTTIAVLKAKGMCEDNKLNLFVHFTLNVKDKLLFIIKSIECKQV